MHRDLCTAATSTAEEKKQRLTYTVIEAHDIRHGSVLQCIIEQKS